MRKEQNKDLPEKNPHLLFKVEQICNSTCTDALGGHRETPLGAPMSQMYPCAPSGMETVVCIAT